jgi:hypothetical protein
VEKWVRYQCTLVKELEYRMGRMDGINRITEMVVWVLGFLWKWVWMLITALLFLDDGRGVWYANTLLEFGKLVYYIYSYKNLKAFSYN